MKKYAQAGFTLIELMIVVAIMGGVMTLAVQQYLYYIAKAQVATALVEISQAKKKHRG